MTDPTPAATALVRATERYSALARVWHDSRPTHTLPFERCVWSECQIERHDALIAALAAAEAPGRVAALEVEAACSDRGCLHYDDEEPPCVGHMPSICCAKLSASIGAAAVADYRDVTLAAAETPGRVAALEAALEGLVRKMAPHSGSCCDFMEDGAVIVTPESCKCGPVERAAHEVLDWYGTTWKRGSKPSGALAAPAPTPSDPVARCEACDGNFVDGYCAKHDPSNATGARDE